MRRTFIRKYDLKVNLTGDVIPLILFWRKFHEEKSFPAWWQILYVFETAEQRDSVWNKLVTGMHETVGVYSDLYATKNYMDQDWLRLSTYRIARLDPPNEFIDPQIEVWYP